MDHRFTLSKPSFPLLVACCLIQGVVELLRCIVCLKDGAWPKRADDVEEVDVDKLKDMVHVKDEDIAKLGELLTVEIYNQIRDI